MNRMRVVAGTVLGLLVVVGGLAWWLGYFSDSPDEVSIDAAVEAATSADGDSADGDSAETTDGTEPAVTGDDGASTAGDSAATDTGVDGTWVVDTKEDVTFVGYRINEVLTTIGDFEVVGRTSEISGSMEIEGTTVTATSIEAQMASLTTDSGSRDRAMRSQALETDQFPVATFELTAPLELGAVPEVGETITATASGDLTVHGVTQPVEFPLEAQSTGDQVIVVGQIEVALADFGIDPPSAPVVASVEETAILELSVAFIRS